MSSWLLHFSISDHNHAFGGADLLTLIESSILSYTSFTVPANTDKANVKPLLLMELLIEGECFFQKHAPLQFYNVWSKGGLISRKHFFVLSLCHFISEGLEWKYLFSGKWFHCPNK